MLASTLFIASLFLSVSAFHVLHEQRSHIPHQWTLDRPAPSDEVLPMRVYLTQSNLELIDDLLHAVSDPDSASYAKHMSSEQVADMFAPQPATEEAVVSWFKESGIDEGQITRGQSRGWLEVALPVHQIESMLKTEYSVFRHVDGREHFAATEYHVPAHLSEHIDMITPTLHFDHNMVRNGGNVPQGHLRQRTTKNHSRFWKRAVPKPGAIPHHVAKAIPNVSKAVAKKASLKSCDSYMTLACLKALYKLPSVKKQMQPSELGIVQYSPQSLQYNDLDNFMTTFVKGAKKALYSPKINSILGGKVSQSSRQGDDEYNLGLHLEGNLDVQYAAGLTYPSKINYYQVGPESGSGKHKGSFNAFLDAVDASYCGFQGGDTIDPGTFDVKFPKKDCGKTPISNVISTSYNYNEVDLTVKYENRQCAEYAKLGLQGISMIFSSGDFGVASNVDQCLDPKKGTGFKNGTSFTDGDSGLFVPSFPSSCPYVTSVGATEVPEGESWKAGEQAAEDYGFDFSSAGGFSNNFAIPSYQKSAVKKYLSTAKLPSKKLWNSGGKARGFPDLSANGMNYLVAVGGGPSYEGKYFQISGTSASAPTVAAIIAMINQERAAKGKKPVGFINNVIYKNPGAFNDITKGKNMGCGVMGFRAAKGWE